jgi:hypothetical protein
MEERFREGVRAGRGQGEEGKTYGLLLAWSDLMLCPLRIP